MTTKKSNAKKCINTKNQTLTVIFRHGDEDSWCSRLDSQTQNEDKNCEQQHITPASAKTASVFLVGRRDPGCLLK
jgi:hypothetical protein